MNKRFSYFSKKASDGVNEIFVIVIILGFLLSGLSSYLIYSDEHNRSFSKLSVKAEIDNNEMKGNLEHTIILVRSIRALFGASDHVTLIDFEKFSSVEMLLQQDIQAVSWAPRVSFSELKQFEAAARGDGLVNFSVLENSKEGVMVNVDQRDEYYPVHYIYPTKGNEAAIGFDLASNPSRLAILNRARDTGELQFTQRLTLVQETGNSYGILVVVPIYNVINIPKSIAERQDEIRGFATGVLRISDILLNLRNETDYKSYVFDLSANKGQQVLFPKGSDIQDSADLKLATCIKLPIEIGGSSWISVHCDKDSFDDLGGHFASTIVFLGFIIITIIVAFYVRNIIQQKATHTKVMRNLQNSENRYRDLVDNTDVLIQSTDTWGKMLFVNKGWMTALGYVDDEITNLNFFEIVAAEHLDDCIYMIKKATESFEAQIGVTKFVRKDGTQLNVEGHILCRKDELGGLVIHGVFTDETERQKAEDEKVNIGLELTRLIDTANAPIFGIDTTGLVNEWNQRAELLTGFAKADVMGKDLVAGFITDDYKASVEEVLDKALKGEESANYEFQLLNKSGDRIDVLLNSTSRRDANGNIIGVVGVGQDITELKFTQAQVIQSSKLATLGEMSTSVAHELNQPLNVIRMAAGNSRRKISKGTAGFEYLNAKLERIEEQTARAAAIIDHMRMFGRKAEEKHQSINPRLNVTNALDLMGEQLRLEGIEVVTEFSEDCSSIWGHSIQMEQVILNLLTNARDAMAESEGEGEKKITLRVFEDKVGVHITSQDTGGGIPEKVLPRIFEPFYTTKEMGKGTGLGLSVSYGIIREMKGTLIAENADAGARFTITVPAAAEYRFYGKS